MSNMPFTNVNDKHGSIWLMTANVVEERLYGPGGKEIRKGTKHFRGGAKVYIVDAYWGMAEFLTVIGHHRSSGRYEKLDMKKQQLENFRMTLCYSPQVIKMAVGDELTVDDFPSKEELERQLERIESWL